MVNEEWFRRRLLDFRNGNGLYLRFLLAFANTIIIGYFFLVERISFFDDVFTNIASFAVIFLAIYIPLSVLFGLWHMRTQQRTEVASNWEQRPLMAKTFLLILKISQDKATKKELEEMREFFNKIERREFD